MLDEWLRKRGLRDKTELHYLYPLPRVFPIETVSEVATPLLEERNVQITTLFNAETVDTERKVISSIEGEEIPYDLLVLIPPHRGASVIEASGLGDEQGWLPTDRATLEVKGQLHLYALGDATDLPVSKSACRSTYTASLSSHAGDFAWAVAPTGELSTEGSPGIIPGDPSIFPSKDEMQERGNSTFNMIKTERDGFLAGYGKGYLDSGPGTRRSGRDHILPTHSAEGGKAHVVV